MAQLAAIESGFHRIPLPVVLTDSMHGEMRAFELNTIRLHDADGAEGVGYTFTVGRNGGGGSTPFWGVRLGRLWLGRRRTISSNDGRACMPGNVYVGYR